MANANQLEVITRLEALHQDKGLKITQGFTQDNPNQAYGYLNGERFSFLFEYLKATLRVGTYSKQVEELYLQRKEGIANAVLSDLESHVNEGLLTEEDKALYLQYHPRYSLREETDTDFAPLILNQISHFVYEDDADDYRSELSEEEIFTVFNTLIATLEAPEKGAGLPHLAKTLLHGGWEEYYKVYYGDDDYGFRDSIDVLNIEHHINTDLRQAVINMLEDKYQNDGLRFLEGGFRGAVPVQAFGHIRGMRFYFRFRSNTAGIKIGPYVQEIEDLFTLRYNESDAARLVELEEKYQNNEIELESYAFQKQILSSGTNNRASGPDDTQFVPTRIVHASSCEGITPGDTYNGSLDGMESIIMFNRLMDNLQDIPEGEQVDEYTQILLYQGWDAAKQWSKERYGY